MSIDKIKKLLKQRILIFDGAMGTEIDRIYHLQNKTPTNPKDLLNIYDYQLIKSIHLSYIDAGADFIETNSFNSNDIVLSEYNLNDKIEDLNKTAVLIAKDAIKTSKKDVFIAGSVGPLNISLTLGSKYSFDDIKKAYRKQVELLLKYGADLIIFETAHDIINLKAGLVGVCELLSRYDNLPVIASVTVDKNGFMLSGHNIKSSYYNISHFDLIAFGINCSTGPNDMELTLKNLSEISDKPVFIMPNADIPDENGNYNLKPEIFSTTIKNYADKGYINIAGGCCGTNPQHIKLLSDRLKELKPRVLKENKKFVLSHKISISEDEIEMPYLCAERLNTLGSKKFKRLVEEKNINEIISISKLQIEKGAHVLDISFINPERNEIDDLFSFLPVISNSVTIPLMIDSTDTNIFENALKLTGAALILNSVNFENGNEKPLKAVELNKKYGALIVCGLIDEKKELAYRFEDKINIAKRAFDFFIKHNIPKERLIFDPLTFSIALTDYEKSAIDTINTVKWIKENLGVKTILGISNVSFGLTPLARKYLNSVFLNLAIKFGLDLAIVNITEQIPYAFIDDKIKDLCTKIIEGDKSKINDLISLTNNTKIEKKDDVDLNLKEMIIKGINTNLEKKISDLLKEKKPIDIINDIAVSAMQEVGKLFADGKLIITDVLSSASVMQQTIDILKPYMGKDEFKRGRVLLATVKGDVHNIGKNLVSIIFESNGFEVIDLGVKVESEIIVKNAKKIKPDVIGLSGLLSKSTEYMLEVAKLLKEEDIRSTLIVGGAAVTEKLVNEKIKKVYPHSIYAKDAVDGLNKIIDNNRDINKNKNSILNFETNNDRYDTKNLTPDFVPDCNDFNRHIIKDFDLNILFENIDYDLLYLRFFNLKKSQIDKIKEMNNEILKLKDEIIKEKYIKVNAIYQIFKSNSQDNEIILFDKDNREITRIKTNKTAKGLSLSNFILPLKTGRKDLVALTVASSFINEENIYRLINKNEFKKLYMINSISIMLSQAMTEVLNDKIKEKLSIINQKSISYSPGYPSIDISINKDIFDILKANEIGTNITQSFMLEPESSVQSIVLHNPKAFYI